MSDYKQKAADIRRGLPASPEVVELVRYAALAPNGHNTQPWRFALHETGAKILPDFTRRTPIVDPDDHHLFVSLGCAAENFALAAQARLGPAEIAFEDKAVGVDFFKNGEVETELFKAIPARQSTRADYDGQPVSVDDLRLPKAASAIEGVSVRLITDQKELSQLTDFVVEGNSLQLDDLDFVGELKNVIRFNAAEALSTRDGLYAGCSGNPSLPGWLGRIIFPLVLRKKSETKKYVQQMQSSAGVAVFVGDRADPEHWVRVGRSFQRFALQATILDIRHAHVNQPVEVRSVRHEFADWLGAREARPDLVIRFGRGPRLPMSLRRPVQDVIVK